MRLYVPHRRDPFPYAPGMAASSRGESPLRGHGIQITPSILTADFADLGAELARIPSSDWIHVDVMDNHFVPNLTFGPTMVEALSKATPRPIDAHLMITDADRNAPAYVEA